MSTIPEDAKQPTDHREPAAQRETEAAETVTVKHKGKSYTLPAAPEDWPVKVARAYEDDRPTNASALLLEWSGHRTDDLSVRDIAAIFEAYAALAGFSDAGE